MKGLFGFAVGTGSIIGDRKSQQDASGCCASPDGTLLLTAVCDGMGGLKGGEQASQTAVDMILSRFRDDPPASLAEAAPWMMGLLREADAAVANLQGPDGERLGAGCTCVMLLSDGSRYQWACVGDSSIKLLRGKRMVTLTRKHNYYLKLDQMLHAGQITQAEYSQKASRGEALISFLGMGNLSLIDIPRDPLTWAEGDVVLLCSDGLYKALSDEQILAIVQESGGNAQLACDRLCSESRRLSRRALDNTTVITVSPGEGGTTSAQMHELHAGV